MVKTPSLKVVAPSRSLTRALVKTTSEIVSRIIESLFKELENRSSKFLRFFINLRLIHWHHNIEEAGVPHPLDNDWLG